MVLALGGALLLLLDPYTRVISQTFRSSFARLLNIGPGYSDEPPIQMLPANGGAVSQAEYERLYTAYKNTYAQLLEMQRRLSTLQKIEAALPVAGSPLLLASVTNAIITAEEQGLLIHPTSQIDTVRPGQYVLGRDSMIGSISEVYRTTARVRLVTDAKHRMLVAVGRSGRNGYIHAQMEGLGNGTAHLVNLSRKEHDVRVGDAVYAAARPGHLATEVMIGEVAEAQEDPDHPLLWDIRVRPVCRPETLRNVAIVIIETAESVDGR